ncbi:creatine transporter [Lojkania enalia]|uniref:Creatine transporter n=1 Tax=Lojkania enalia TaxID=147567 RepID=A0A9P4MW40_9PLEO|nr:creatine transporter [Didymosphaeria enalia]
MAFGKRLLFGKSKQTEDGRDQWGSRTAYVLASMGGAVGFGNLLRYPSQVFNNNGLQWFIPYLMAIFLLAVPVLVLEVSIGQAYRGGSVIAYNSLDKRARGVGMGMILVGFYVCLYYIPMLAWVLRYFEKSFSSPLPWEGRIQEFYRGDVTQDVAPVGGEFNDDGSIASYATYPGTAVVPETAAWTFFAWFMVWLCLAKGVATTGKVVYFTMGLPIVVLIVLIGRGTSLPNARDGICLFWCEFNGDQLSRGQIWQDATGQVFYSTGVGFGYFTAYASYNSQMANAVADSFIICLSNASFETLAAFAIFGVVGFLGITPESYGSVSSFELGFVTLPEALTQLPGSQVWSVIFFFTLFLLGLSSSFAMIDAAITMVYDADFAKRWPRIAWSSIVVTISFLMSLMYTTEFGFWLLDAIDTQTNNIALIWIVWAECISATILYRHRDVIGQVGLPAFLVHNGGFIVAKIVGLAIAHTVSPGGGAGAGFGIYFASVIVSLVVAKTPDCVAPRFWGKNVWLSKLWWLGAYSGNQLTRDLNVTVAPPGSGNTRIPVFWAPILRYFSAPVLAIVLSFGYPKFIAVRNDPLHIFAFTAVHIILFFVIFVYFVPRSLDIIVPAKRRDEGVRAYAPQVLCGLDDIRVSEGLEASTSSDGHISSVEQKYDVDGNKVAAKHEPESMIR